LMIVGQRGPARLGFSAAFVPRTFPGGVVELSLDRARRSRRPSELAVRAGGRRDFQWSQALAAAW
jgi:hypothetical protein